MTTTRDIEQAARDLARLEASETRRQPLIDAWISGYVQSKTNFGTLPSRVLVGLCGSASLELARVFGLRAVPGWVLFQEPEDGEPIWHVGAEHVWCEDGRGTIYDPTVLQFEGAPIVRYVPWRPGDSVRTGRCMVCGWDIYRPVQSLDYGQKDCVCDSEECRKESVW